MKHAWTIEKVRALPLNELKALRANAVKKNAQDLVALCETELGARIKPKAKAVGVSSVHSGGDYVAEYHFICRDDKGVRILSDGRWWTASWAVAEATVVKSLKFGAVLALHSSKQEASYRQGKIIGFERVNTYDEGEQEWRIDFLVDPTPESLDWFGDGTGEKGYRWEKIAGTKQQGSAE